MSESSSVQAAAPGSASPEPATPGGVAQALARLGALEGRPVDDHVEVFDDVHRMLQDALATLDEA